GAEAPEIRRIAQLSLAFVDIKIDGLQRSTGKYNTVITCRLEIRRPVSARRPTSESRVSERAKVYSGHLGATGREASAGERAGHHDDDILRPEWCSVQGQFFQQNVRSQCLAADEFFQDRFFG